MKKVLTAAQMQKADAMAINRYKIPGLLLMENAGRGLVERALQLIPGLEQKRILIFCGKGNNGGDGFVMARHLANRGTRVEIALIGKCRQLKGDASINATIAQRSGIPIQEISDNNLGGLQHTLRHSQVIIDALFGTGLGRPPEGLFAKVIDKINASGKYVLSIDIPSGIDSDTGLLNPPYIKAQATLALAQYKRSHVLYPAREAMGTLELVEIGLPLPLIESLPGEVMLMEEDDISPLFPRRKRNSHKGTYGHLLVIAGARGKAGAAGLAGLAGLRAGAGLVTLAVPQSLLSALELHPMETMTLPLPETSNGEIAAEAADILKKNLKGKTAVALGPGLGTHSQTIECLEAIFPTLKLPLVIDADGLNCIAQSKNLLRSLPGNSVLTPHPKEMSRLIKKDTSELLREKINITRQFSRRHQVSVILKGAGSILSLPDGRVRINPTGNPGLATGGSGDVLTGLIGGLLAQGIPPENAATAGMYLHGLTADSLAAVNSETSLIAGDLLRLLPDVIHRILP